ncbi:MAG: NlpC/P60 family protein [Myxococcaceae bacterium]
MTTIRTNPPGAIPRFPPTGLKNPQDLVNWVMKNAAGKPYVWGGTGGAGYDCSGLVMKAFEGIGLPIKPGQGGMRSTTLINGTKKMAMEKVLGNPPVVGAVLYMPPGKDGIPHIGIYMGKGADGKDKVIESRGGKGVGVYNFSDIPWKEAGVVSGMSNVPPNLTELNNVQGGGQIGGGSGGKGGGDALADGSLGPGATDSDRELAKQATDSADKISKTGSTVDKMLMDALWAQLDKKNAQAAAEKIMEIAPEASPQFAQQIAKLLMNPMLAKAIKENPLLLQQLLNNPDLKSKLMAGEDINVGQLLADMEVTPEGAGTFTTSSAGGKGLVDLGMGDGAGTAATASGSGEGGIASTSSGVEGEEGAMSPASPELSAHVNKMRRPAITA